MPFLEFNLFSMICWLLFVIEGDSIGFTNLINLFSQWIWTERTCTKQNLTFIHFTFRNKEIYEKNKNLLKYVTWIRILFRLWHFKNIIEMVSEFLSCNATSITTIWLVGCSCLLQKNLSVFVVWLYFIFRSQIY